MTPPVRGAGMTSTEGSLLGRAEEWKRITDALDHVRRGSSSVLMLHGEAGIGKTRLIRELVAHAEHSGFAVLAGRAEDLERMRPFGAIADAVANFARQRAQDVAGVDDLAKELSNPSNPVDAIDRFVELVEELALSRPTCVVLEDLHWADGETISAGRALLRRLAYLPFLFVGTFRPHPQLAELARFVDVALSEGATIIELGRLDDEAVQALGAEILRGDVGPQLSKTLEAAAGNPLYVAELARALQEEGSLQLADGTVDGNVTQLPPTLRLTILRRLSQFPSETLEILKHAAVLGATFQLHEVAVVSSRDVADVAGHLEAPIAARIIEERDARFGFRHDLIHEAIYQDIPSPIRASMHIEIAHKLRALGVPLVRVAEHMIRGLDLGDPQLFDEAVALAYEIETQIPAVALALADKALALVDEERRDEIRRYMAWPLLVTGRNDEAERLAREVLRRATDPQVEAEMGVILGEALGRDGRSTEAIAFLEQQVANPRFPRTNIRILSFVLAGNLLRVGYGKRARALVEPFRDELRDADDPLSAPSAVLCDAGIAICEGRVNDAVRFAEESIDMDKRHGHPAGAMHLILESADLLADRLEDARAACEQGRHRDSERADFASLAIHSSMEAFICFVAGSWDDALAQSKLAGELVTEAAASPWSFFLALTASAQIALRRGDVEGALRTVAEAERMVAEKGPQAGMDLIGWTKALCIEATRDPARAFEAAIAGWQATMECRHAFGRTTFPDLARLAVIAGDRERASEVTEAAEEGRRRAEEVPSAVGAAQRCRGILEDDPDLLVAAVDAYRRSPRVVERAGVCEDAALSLARRRAMSDARALFEEALAIFEELEATHDSSRVLAAMRSLGIRRGSRAPRRRPATGWDALTPTELDVARLTIEGLSNPKIAERLFVSKRTVQTHLSHIFGKLGISSRVALARVAAERPTPAHSGPRP